MSLPQYSGPTMKTVVLPSALLNTSTLMIAPLEMRFGAFDDPSELDAVALPNNIISIEVEGHYLAWFDELTAELGEELPSL